MPAVYRLVGFRDALFVSALIVVVSARSTRAQPAFFMGLGDLPGGDYFSRPVDVSADGSVVVGESTTASGNVAFRWTRDTGMVGLDSIGPQSIATAVSNDGLTVAGAVDGKPFRWTQSTGGVLLTGPGGGVPHFISADGSLVIGLEVDRWTPSGGYEDLFAGWAVDASADGSVILDREVLPNHGGATSAFIWTANKGLVPLASEGNTFSHPSVISGNGKVVVGLDLDRVDAPGTNTRAVKWSEQTGVTEIATLPGGAVPGSAWGVSLDGSLIVGTAYGGTDPGPYLWDENHGSRNLVQLLSNDYGLASSLAGWTSLSNSLGDTFPSGLSADGRSIVGIGINPNGQREGWIAFLGTPVPEPSTLLLISLVFVPIVRRRRRSSPALRPGTSGIREAFSCL